MSEPVNIVFNAEVDAIGMNCPLPILRTKKALATMQSGEVLKIKATDAAPLMTFLHLPNKLGMSCLQALPKVMYWFSL